MAQNQENIIKSLRERVAGLEQKLVLCQQREHSKSQQSKGSLTRAKSNANGTFRSRTGSQNSIDPSSYQNSLYMNFKLNHIPKKMGQSRDKAGERVRCVQLNLKKRDATKRGMPKLSKQQKREHSLSHSSFSRENCLNNMLATNSSLADQQIPR